MDSQINDKFFATFLREEQGLNLDFVGSSLAKIQEDPHIPISSQSPVLVGNRNCKRGGNFSIEDDNLVVSSWLTTSLDSIIESEQKQNKFWDRIRAYFHQYKKPHCRERSTTSLRNRWSVSQQCTNKFCEFFAQIEAMHPSGTNLQDQMTKEMYQQIMKSTFYFECCWNVLRHQPKWQANASQKGVKSKRMSLPSDSSSTPNLFCLDEDKEDSPSQSVYSERPLGKKVEKEVERKRKCTESSIGKATKILTLLREERKESHEDKMKRQDEMVRLKKEKIDEMIRLNKKEIELQNVIHEEKIMMMDTSDLTEEQAQYVKYRRDKIMVKYVSK